MATNGTQYPPIQSQDGAFRPPIRQLQGPLKNKGLNQGELQGPSGNEGRKKEGGKSGNGI